ncbi:MAG TPA: fructosamine kinase family protein [Pseudonocardia sp.]|nr:fructosamine kinase family protein [Pseudonocardia sp.]
MSTAPRGRRGIGLEAVVSGLTGHEVRPGGSRTRPRGVVELADGRQVLVKHSDDPGAIPAEAAGLAWLAVTGAADVAEVLGHDDQWLVLGYLPPAAPTAVAAAGFGRGLARLHAAGAPAFGAPPPGGPVQAWIGRAPMRNETGDDWAPWYVAHRVRPYLDVATRRGDLGGDEVALIRAACEALPEVAGPGVAPARCHGDLWSGNVCWSGDPARGWLIDPAAHGGHPETDLAMLALFGCPHLDAVLSGYQEVSPLAPGWRARVGMHQLFPLLVHVVLFGSGYAGQAAAAARSVLRIAQRLT